MTWDNESVHPVSELDPELETARELIELEQISPGQRSRLISRVLTPALRLWIRSQVDHIEELELTIEASDRQLLSGSISRITASAHKAIYRGLHFSQLQVRGQQIQTNLRQVLRGKPFRLLAAFPITGKVSLSEADLNASLNAPLLATAVMNFLLPLVSESASPPPTSLQNMRVQLETNELTLTAILTTPTLERSIALRTGLRIKKGNILVLEGFQYRSTVDQLLPIQDSTTSFTIPLGSDVYLEELAIRTDYLMCQGQIMVRPGE